MKKSLFLRIKALRFAIKTKHSIMKACEGVGTEAQETKDMAKLFYQMLANKLELSERKDPPSPEEVKKAIEQLKDIGRISIFTGISIIPGGGFSLIGLELLARRFGIRNFTFVPSAFRKVQNITGGTKKKPVDNALEASEKKENPNKT